MHSKYTAAGFCFTNSVNNCWVIFLNPRTISLWAVREQSKALVRWVLLYFKKYVGWLQLIYTDSVFVFTVCMRYKRRTNALTTRHPNIATPRQEKQCVLRLSFILSCERVRSPPTDLSLPLVEQSAARVPGLVVGRSPPFLVSTKSHNKSHD